MQNPLAKPGFYEPWNPGMCSLTCCSFCTTITILPHLSCLIFPSENGGRFPSQAFSHSQPPKTARINFSVALGVWKQRQRHILTTYKYHWRVEPCCSLERTKRKEEGSREEGTTNPITHSSCISKWGWETLEDNIWQLLEYTWDNCSNDT